MTKTKKYSPEVRQRAVRMVQEAPGHIDLVVLDVVMPEMNGPEVALLLRKADHDIPILLTTAYSSATLDGVLALPATSLLRKPFRSFDLVQAVGKNIRIAAAHV